MLPALVLVAIATTAAAPAHAHAAWTPSATITTRGAVQFDLAMGADGTAALAWVDGGVRVSVKRPGRAWSAARRLSDGRSLVTGPTLAVDGHGDVLAAWVQSSPPGPHRATIVGPLTIRAAIRHGSTWGASRQVGVTSHFFTAAPDLAANARGDAVLVWRGLQPGRGGRRVEAIQSALRSPGAGFGGAQTASRPGPRRGLSGQVVALDARGTAHVAWTDDSGPVVRLATRPRGAQGRWGTPRTLGASPASNPAIAVTSDGTAIVAWHAAGVDSEGNGLQSGALDTAALSASGTLAPVQQISAAHTRTYRLATGPAGVALLTFVADGGAGGLQTATRPAGGPFAAPLGLPQITPDAFAGGAAYLGDGTALGAWGQNGRVRVFDAAAGGTFGTTAQLDRAGLYPRIATSGHRAVLAWNLTSGNRVSILAATRR